MTTSPNADTLYEVVGSDHYTIAYFPAGASDEAHAYSASVAGSKVMIYLKPAPTFAVNIFDQMAAERRAYDRADYDHSGDPSRS